MNTIQRIGLFLFILGQFSMQNFPDVLDSSNIHKFEFMLFVSCLGAAAFIFFPSRT